MRTLALFKEQRVLRERAIGGGGDGFVAAVLVLFAIGLRPGGRQDEFERGYQKLFQFHSVYSPAELKSPPRVRVPPPPHRPGNGLKGRNLY